VVNDGMYRPMVILLVVLSGLLFLSSGLYGMTGVIQAAEDNGLIVPEELGVTGFDNTPLLALARPKLTTVKVPAYRFGEEVSRQLFDGEVKALTLPVRLIPRPL